MARDLPAPTDEQLRAREGIARGRQLLRRHVADPAPPDEFELLGRTWTLRPGVFAPIHTPVTALFTSWLRFAAGSRFLEMGCGTGVTAVCAALGGCTVTALDVSHAAVANTRDNAGRHGVAGRVDVRHSDLFDALGPDERFDTIYWNSNFVLVPDEYEPASELEHAFFDPGYEAHRRFVAQGPRHLRRGGRLLLGFSDKGSWPQLRSACAAAGLVADVVRAQRVELEVAIEFQLVELRPDPAGPAAP